MDDRLTESLATIGIHHLWQAGLLLLLAVVMLRLRPLNGSLRSWAWLSVLVVTALLPLAVFLPGESHINIAPSTSAVFVDRSESPLAAPAANTSLVASLADPWVTSETVTSLLKSIVICIWLVGFVWNLIRLWQGWSASRRLWNTSEHAPALERLVATNLPDHASINVSDNISSPMAVGLWHPHILVPRNLAAELQDTALRDILHHEIAHIRRRDIWVSLLERIVVSFYWWSPFQRAIAAELNLAREMACDEYAANVGGCKRYASSLLSGVDKMIMHDQRLLLATGIFSTRKDLARRIEGLLDMDSIPKSGYKKSAVLCALVLASSVALALAATPRIDDTVQIVDNNGFAKNDPTTAVLIEAVQSNQIAEVRKLVSNGADINMGVSGDGTALIVAAKNGNKEMVDTLLAMGANVDQAWSGDGNPLIAASAEGHVDIVARLLAAGADVNAVCHMDETSLIAASRRGHLPVVKYLVENGGDVNLAVQADFDRWRSPLNQASDSQIRNYLISKGARSNGNNTRK